LDFVKLDFITPGSPSNGVNLPADESGEVIAWHKAISQCGRKIRLDISWKLDRSEKYFAIWGQNADSMRTDQDINNSGSSNFVNWATVQRAFENYRQWIVAGLQQFKTLHIYPDLDNLYVANDPSVDGINNVQQQTMMSHWIGAGANLILGDDLTRISSSGLRLLTHPTVQAISAFTARYPMQPRNPGSGKQDPKQMQAWISGPSPSGEAVVLLVNYGPDQGQGGFGTVTTGSQQMTISYADLGIHAPYKVYDVWNDNYWGDVATGLNVGIPEGQSYLLHLTRP
jgi:alpha-galactosidase